MQEGDLTALLTHGTLTVVGRLVDASNLALLVDVVGDGASCRAIYKPEAGEKPLWDFPTGGLARRERAAWLVSAAGGWQVVPPTVLRSGPYGEGSVQVWIGEDPQEPCPSPVEVVAADRVPAGVIPVLSGEDEQGRPVVVTHADDPRVAAVAVFDAVINNSDRKGGHLLDHQGHLWGIDHGVCFHADDKLRTVLWGWAGEPLPAAEVRRLTDLDGWLHSTEDLDDLLTVPEVSALQARVARLLRTGAFPVPSGDWPSVPWPPL